MRVALVQIDLGVRHAGIDNALVGQARAASDVGTPLDVIVVNASRTGVVDGVRYVQHPPIPPRLRRASRLLRARLLASAIDPRAYDVVFLRYPTAVDLDPLAFVRSQRARVATVHHAKEAREILAGPRTLITLGRAALEHVQGKRVLRRVDGVVGVTDELSEFQGARAGEGVPTFTHANGIDVRAVSPTGFVPFDGRHLRLVFTASSFAPWHGTDRLLASLRAYDGPLTVTLDLVGAGSGRAAGTEERAGRTTVRHHGALYGGDLGRVLAGANIAVSTLAFHRTGLREGAVLKTREYLARGVPLVLGYDDVDVPEGLPFVLQVPNDDALLSVEALADFAERTGRIRNLTAEMRAYAERVLDWRIKLPRLEEFARRLLDSPKRHAAR